MKEVISGHGRWTTTEKGLLHHWQMTIWKDKLRAAGIHLCLSLAVAALAAWLVFALWYPYPYREISGGRALFALVTGVDVVLGPLMTLVVFNRAKRRREKLLDFSVIGVLQLAALGYGLWTVAQARPVHLVFNYDRFTVAHAAEVEPEALVRAPQDLRSLPWTGPTPISLRPLSPQESTDVTLAELAGAPAAARPELWQSYAAGRAAVLAAAKPASELARRFADRSAEIAQALQRTGRHTEDLAYLPLAARNEQFWTVIIDGKNAEILGFLALDSF